MFKVDQIKSMFNCKLCSKLLVDPIVTPCGNTVCQSHLKEFVGQNNFKCQCCEEQHPVPNGGFEISKLIQNLLRIELNSIDLNPVYEECKKEIEEANKNVAKLEEMKNNSEVYIYNYFEDIKRQVDLRREVFKDKIDVYSNEVIQSINKTQAKYIKSSKETSEMNTKIEKSKKTLNELINKFDTLKIDEKKFHDIKDKVVFLNQALEKNDTELKSSLVAHKYSFDYEDRPIKDIFGIFTETDTFNSKILNGYLSMELRELCEFSQNQKWDLIYRATEDGFDENDFHSNCDGTQNTITIIESTKGSIIGCYCKQALNSTKYLSDIDDCVFSLVNKDKKPFKSKIKDYHSFISTCFSHKHSNNNQMNRTLAGVKNFSLEIEVFTKRRSLTDTFSNILKNSNSN